MKDEVVAAILNVGYATEGGVRLRSVEEQLEPALKEGARVGARSKPEEQQCAHLMTPMASAIGVQTKLHSGSPRLETEGVRPSKYPYSMKWSRAEGMAPERIASSTSS